MYSNNRGFTLLEVMIAAAVGLIVLFALASQMSNNNRQVHLLEAKMESIQLKQELMLLLSDSTKCTSSLSSVTNLDLTAGATTDISTLLAGPLQGLVTNYTSSNSRYISVSSVLLLMPANKMDGTPNTSTPYEFHIKMTAKEKTAGAGLNMNIDGPTLTLNVTGTSVSSCYFPAMTPTIRRVTAHYSAWRWPGGPAACNSDEHVISGGVYCYSGVGWMVIAGSIPSGNGWYGACDTSVDTWAYADVYALCQRN